MTERVFTNEEIVRELTMDGLRIEDYVVIRPEDGLGTLYSIELNTMFAHLLRPDALYVQAIRFIKENLPENVYPDVATLKENYPNLMT
ncbi:hypothetical protein ACN9MU_09530 [Pseudoduganella sp. R-32]|uniref:hypothetical protein n=1 Tax=Pseudoduganella sp. R-32 TaxID=3404061 RepID=UPI003CF6BB7E